MRIGMHVRGFERGRPVAAELALERGAETIQIFASNPRAWHLTAPDPDADRELARQLNEHDVRPLFLHAPYVVNLASPSAEFRRRSERALAWTLARAVSLEAPGVVVHAGSAGTRSRGRTLKGLSAAITRLLGDASGPRLVFELTAGGRGAVACNFTEAAELLEAAGGHPRVAICIDTCHLHAAGYDIASEQGVGSTVEELSSMVGIDRLALVHANDSRDPRGSRRDRHWQVGRGEIGRAGFRSLLQHSQLQEVPVICETPGVLSDDRRNIKWLKRLRVRA